MIKKKYLKIEKHLEEPCMSELTWPHADIFMVAGHLRLPVISYLLPVNWGN